jgi:hypothetical protein
VVRFEVLTAVNVSVVFFSVETPCGVAGIYQSFGGTLITIYSATRRHNPQDHNRHECCIDEGFKDRWFSPIWRQYPGIFLVKLAINIKK